MKKMYFIITGIILVLLLTILIVSLVKPKEATTLRLGYNAGSLSHAPIFLAYDLNLFEKYNITAELIPLKSGKEIQQALAVGQIEIGATGVAQFFNPISKGAPIKVISFLSNGPSKLYVRPNNITKFSELENKTIASTPGSLSTLTFLSILKRENIDTNAITILDIDPAYIPIALMDKKIIDATVVGGGKDELYIKAGSIVLKEWDEKGYSEESYPRSVIGVNTNFSENNLDIIKSFILIFIETQKYIKEHPNEAALLIAEHIKKDSANAIVYTSDEIINLWGTENYLLWGDQNVVVMLSNTAKDLGQISKSLTINEIFDLKFEDVLRKSQEEIYN
jgi:ABC-type nitrate/sulfonate/bicarbonate transport system substrate-binding protein